MDTERRPAAGEQFVDGGGGASRGFAQSIARVTHTGSVRGATICDSEPAHDNPAALAVGALGVVFGDIGTSPLYTLQAVFNPSDPHPVRVSTQTIFGIVSLIFWSRDHRRHRHLRACR